MSDRRFDSWIELLRDAALEGAGQPLRIAQLCVDMLDVSGAGISLVSDTGAREVVCATDDVAMHIEELQVTLGEGPCMDAVTDGRRVLVPDLGDASDAEADRWPEFRAAATDAGVRAVFAFPLRIGVINFGGLDLYRSHPGALDEDQLSAAMIAAEAIGVGLLALPTTGETGISAQTGREVYQAQVHQASGMVMVQAGVTIEQAFLLLRARAFSSGRMLAEVSADVVTRRLRFDSED